MIGKEYNSIIELLQAFPNEQSCIDYLEKLRWDCNIISPFDSTSKIYKCKGNKYYCNNTGKYFNVKTNTLFENTKINLQKWFLAIWLITSHKKGISSLQLSRDIKVTQKTAWFMLQRIRNCYGVSDSNIQLENEVEIDETFVGGKNKNRHADKK
jgi:transposase-like protein